MAGTITIRIDESTREDLEALALAKGTNVSALLRDQIDSLLGREVNMRRGDVPISLPMDMRLMLAQQAQILAVQDPDNTETHREHYEILTQGYTSEYGRVFTPVLPELTRSECQFVQDVVEMFLALDRSIKALDLNDRAVLGPERLGRLRFQGFDANDATEVGLLLYTRWLATHGWSQVRPWLEAVDPAGEASQPCLPHYLRLLKEYNSMMFDVILMQEGPDHDARLDFGRLVKLAEARP